MITVSQIRERLLNFLSSEDPIALDEFDEWFSEASWDMHRTADIPSQQFASAVELKLAEYDSGRLDMSVLRRQLSELASVYSLQLSLDPIQVVSGSSSIFISEFQQWAVSLVDMKPVMA